MERKYTHRSYMPIHKDFPYNPRRGWELRIFVDKDMVHTIEIYICQRYLHRALNTDNILIASTRTTSLYYYHNLNRFISYTLSIVRIVPPRQQSFPPSSYNENLIHRVSILRDLLVYTTKYIAIHINTIAYENGPASPLLIVHCYQASITVETIPLLRVSNKLLCEYEENIIAALTSHHQWFCLYAKSERGTSKSSNLTYLYFIVGYKFVINLCVRIW